MNDLPEGVYEKPGVEGRDRFCISHDPYDDFEGDQNFGEYYPREDDFEDLTDDDVCCWDFRYTGPEGHCHCKDYQEQMFMESRWWYPIYFKFIQLANRISYFWWGVRMRYIAWTKRNDLKKCHGCGLSFKNKKWKGLECPMCGFEDLPF